LAGSDLLSVPPFTTAIIQLGQCKFITRLRIGSRVSYNLQALLLVPDLTPTLVEYETMNSKSTMDTTTGTKAVKRPWDVFFGDTDIKEDDVAFVIAANMLKLYGTYMLL
jgi:hypothetical protein